MSEKRPPRGQKADLFKWVNDQQQLDMRTKFILKELAAFAGPDCCAWCKVDDLAYAANCSPRTVQYHLAALQEARLIKLSGRMHRLDNSTRSVPWYQLAPEVEGLGAPEGMGAKIAPIDAGQGAAIGEIQAAPIEGPWVQSGDSMGATGLHPQMENTGEQSGAKAPSPGAREALRGLFGTIEAAVPKALLKYADREEAFAAFVELAEAGVDAGRLLACARRMAADPGFKTKKFPPTLEDWLGKGQWRGWDGDDAASAAPPTPAFDGPPDLRAAIVTAKGEAFARTTIDFCRFEPGSPGRLIPRTGWIEQQLCAVKRELETHDVIVQGRL